MRNYFCTAMYKLQSQYLERLFISSQRIPRDKQVIIPPPSQEF